MSRALSRRDVECLRKLMHCAEAIAMSKESWPVTDVEGPSEPGSVYVSPAAEAFVHLDGAARDISRAIFELVDG